MPLRVFEPLARVARSLACLSIILTYFARTPKIEKINLAAPTGCSKVYECWPFYRAHRDCHARSFPVCKAQHRSAPFRHCFSLFCTSPSLISISPSTHRHDVLPFQSLRNRCNRDCWQEEQVFQVIHVIRIVRTMQSTILVIVQLHHGFRGWHWRSAIMNSKLPIAARPRTTPSTSTTKVAEITSPWTSMQSVLSVCILGRSPASRFSQLATTAKLPKERR